MIYNKLLTIVTLCLTIAGHLQGQTQFHETNKIIPPSPTAAGLGKYGAVPVSMYNGSPNITVPIYDISTASNSLKIFMQYDASGTRVQQDASWIGLGWSLNAGGVITRTVKQIDDFKTNGYYFTGSLPSPESQEASYYSHDVYYGNVDAEQDVFNFNFNGYSGRFVLGKKVDGAKIYMDEKSNLKIEYLDTQGKWVITTSEGYVYTFSVPESAVNYSLSGLSEFTNINGVAGLTPNYGSQPVTSWYLSSIVSPKNDLISFEYANGKSLSMVNKSEAYSQLLNIVEAYLCTNGQAATGSVKHIYTASRQAMTDVYLKKINFTGGMVEFNTTTREDIEYLNSTDALLVPSKLDNIVIKKANGTVVKKYIFNYSYFNSFNGLNGKRLKLDGITEYSANNSPKPPFTFLYNNANNLPDKYSKSIDHWGFYNNKINSTLLPSTTFPSAQNSFVGADREPDTTMDYPTYGVLKEIQYPTGGKTQFDYELHDYSNLTDQQKYILTNRYAEVRSNSLNPSHNVQSATFVILPDPDYPEDLTKKIPVTVWCSYQKVDPNISNIALAYSNMRRVNSDGSTTSLVGCQSTWDNDNPGMTSTNYNLLPGTYEMYVQATNGWSFFMSASWKEKQIVTQRKGGGIRIMRVTDQDAMGKIQVRRYQYRGDDGKSSGVLITNPVYFGVWGMSRAVNECRFKAQYGIILSGSLFSPGLMSSSGVVGYTKVTELIGENGENGKTEHYFYCVPNQEGTMLQPLVGSPYNGKETIRKYFNAQNNLIKQNTYQYIIGETSVIPSIKIYTDATMEELSQTSPVQGYGYIFSYYNNISRWTIPFNETETILNGSVPITTIKNYTYANQLHRLPTQIVTTRSNNKEVKQVFNYPHEMVAKGINPNNVYSNMIANNIISPPIEIIKSVSGVQSERTMTNYSNIGLGNIIDKSSTEYQIGTLTTQTQILYEYTATGNIRAVQNPGGPKTIYLWGYNNIYPVAEIKNAAYQDVIDVLGQSNIDLIAGGTPGTDMQVRSLLSFLRTDERFRKSLVTTYTYDPLVGMTSSTDAKGLTTYYEYDSFQRLMNVKDQDGNILKHTDYHYQGQ